ncbi:MAG: imm11 family protein [Terriglobia bacterium]
MKYYNIFFDTTKVNGWFLDNLSTTDGKVLDAREFTCGKLHDSLPAMTLGITSGSEPADFSFGEFMLQVVNARTAKILTKIALPDELQMFPVKVQQRQGHYLILNIVKVINCVDENESEFIKWTKRDHRADKAGQYRQISRLRILSDKAFGAQIFRLWGYKVVTVISAKLKTAFERAGVTGISYHCIT